MTMRPKDLKPISPRIGADAMDYGIVIMTRLNELLAILQQMELEAEDDVMCASEAESTRVPSADPAQIKAWEAERRARLAIDAVAAGVLTNTDVYELVSRALWPKP